MDRDQPYDVSETAPSSATPATLYPAQGCVYTNLQPVMPLTNDIATSRAFVQAFVPGGNTNIGIGMQWGIELLSPTQPMDGGVAFDDSTTLKYLILVTDGQNTQNRWSTDTNTIDARTALACTRAKDLGITVFVVRVLDGDSTLLRQCASKSEYFYDLSSATQLNTALSNVFETISKTRLTQ
jgi:Mg-chelatase subunit ChlD